MHPFSSHKRTLERSPLGSGQQGDGCSGQWGMRLPTEWESRGTSTFHGKGGRAGACKAEEGMEGEWEAGVGGRCCSKNAEVLSTPSASERSRKKGVDWARVSKREGFPGGSVVKNLPLISVSGRSPGGGNGNPLQYSCLEKPTDRGAWWATVHGTAKSQTRLSGSTPIKQKGACTC